MPPTVGRSESQGDAIDTKGARARAPARPRRKAWAETAACSGEAGPPGFEPGFEAPEASVISKLYYGPIRVGRGRRSWLVV